MENLKALKGLYRGEKKKQNPVMSWCSNAIRNHSKDFRRMSIKKFIVSSASDQPYVS